MTGDDKKPDAAAGAEPPDAFHISLSHDERGYVHIAFNMEVREMTMPAYMVLDLALRLLQEAHAASQYREPVH